MKLFEIWTSGLGVDVLYRYFLSGALVTLLFSRVEPFVKFGGGYYKEHFCEIILIVNVDQWLRRRCH